MNSVRIAYFSMEIDGRQRTVDSLLPGQLEVLDGPEPGTRAYWLVAPTPQWRTKKVKALVAFLTA